MEERLQKFIARATVFSRRKAEELIIKGAVTVNGGRVTELGTKIDPARDVVCLNGSVVRAPATFRYILLNKPAGYVCTRAQHKGEKTVYDLVPDSRDLVIAGRLDKGSEGLVLLTDDGELVNELTHPKFQHKKTYEVQTDKPISDRDMQTMTDGIRLDEGNAKADHIERLGRRAVRIMLHQGWNRQIRRMFDALGLTVLALRRTQLGDYTLDALATGSFRKVPRAGVPKSPDE